MQIIRDSSLDEYARHFWTKEQKKNGASLAPGIDPLRQLSLPREQGGHRYKLPSDLDKPVKIAILDQNDVEALLIHDYMMHDRWMTDRLLVAAPPSRVLRDLAQIAIAGGYFQDARWRWDKQVQHYYKWQGQGFLANAITGDEKVLIECMAPEQFEIIDGWGRLLPFMALMLQGYQFQPVECFVAIEP